MDRPPSINAFVRRLPWLSSRGSEWAIEILNSCDLDRVIHPTEVLDAIRCGGTIGRNFNHVAAELAPDDHRDLCEIASAALIYWWFESVHLSLAAEHLAFVLKQRETLRETWARLALNIRSPKTKLLAVAFLSSGDSLSPLLISMNRSKDFWGDPADWIPTDAIEKFSIDGRRQLPTFAAQSHQNNFKRAVAVTLYRDSDSYIRRIVRDYIRRGKLPDVRGDSNAEGLLISPFEVEETRRLWQHMRDEPIPNGGQPRLLIEWSNIITEMIDATLACESIADSGQIVMLEAHQSSIRAKLPELPEDWQEHFEERLEIISRILLQSRQE